MRFSRVLFSPLYWRDWGGREEEEDQRQKEKNKGGD
jgi:hypothetical protein